MKLAFTIIATIYCLSLWGRIDTIAWRFYEGIQFQEVEVANSDALQTEANKTIIKSTRDGILWIGVKREALYRFNGHEAIDIYEYISQNQDSILHNALLTTFYLDQEENIWLGTNQGLFKIRTGDFFCKKIDLDPPLFKENYRNQITNLQQQGDTLFVGTQNGLYLIDSKENKVLKSYFVDGNKDGYPRQGTNNAIRSIYLDQLPEKLWISLNDRLCELDLFSGSFTFFENNSTSDKTAWLKQGFIHKDSLIFSPSDRLGLVRFNRNNNDFSISLISESIHLFGSNDVFSLIALNDTIAMLSAFNWGTGLYNLRTNQYKWLSVPSILKFGYHQLDQDHHGYIWSGVGNNIFRSNRALTLPDGLATQSIIDISCLTVNNIQKGIPSLEQYPVYQLEEYERSIDLTFALTNRYLFDQVSMEYQLNGKEWSAIEDPNKISIHKLVKGKNTVKLRAQTNHTTIAERNLIIKVDFPFYKTFWFYFGLTTILLGLGAAFGRYKIAHIRKEERLKANFNKKLAVTESMALRSQINPHFIFNTLNSIKYYAIAKSPSETGEFINRFSALIRQVLENSKQHLIPLGEEISTLNNYIEVEKLRFRNAFESKIIVDPAIDQDFCMIPPSLTQPFVENSIWHGLMHKEGHKKLEIRFTQNENIILCQIIDNGIGRLAAKKINKSKTSKSSLGMQITKDRIEHLQTLYGIQSHFEIIDLYDDEGLAKGTEVSISFSI
ncbi:MAG: hypothetical protein Sapg2KO_48350 [Saprospiraceae bacterium]